MTSKKASVTKHLSLAKRDIAQGTAAFRSAANHIAAAIAAGATQAEAAARVGKSQPWVNRLLKWREGDFKEGSPFAADHERAIISAANNPASRTMPLHVVSTPAEQKVVQLNVTRGEPPINVTRGEPPKAPFAASAEPPALDVLVKLEMAEKAVTDLSLSLQTHGGIEAAGEDVERRILSAVQKLWALADHRPVRRWSN